MADVRPFRALRPVNALADQVIAPPYDVLTDSEARSLASNPISFVRVTRSEVDLPKGIDPHGEETYQQARKNLDLFRTQGTLMQDERPTYYFYGQVMGEHRQVGVLAAASVEEYDRGAIKKHEYTRPDKEDDRTHHMDVLNAQVGLVFLAYPAQEQLAQLTKRVIASEPQWRVTTADGVEHALWPAPPDTVEPIRAAFGEISSLYIADGHHRSAAASRIHQQRASAHSAYFLAGLFPDDQLQVMAYNRVVLDLNGETEASFRKLLAEKFVVSETDNPVPASRGAIHMYLGGRWYHMEARPDVVQMDDPVASLDVAVLQDHVLEPLLGIKDPRRSTRIRFLGGIRGHQALSAAVDEGAGVAFHLYPTGLDQLFQVADAGQVMPPKSTWFEPKLREGVVIRSLDED